MVILTKYRIHRSENPGLSPFDRPVSFAVCMLPLKMRVRIGLQQPMLVLRGDYRDSNIVWVVNGFRTFWLTLAHANFVAVMSCKRWLSFAWVGTSKPFQDSNMTIRGRKWVKNSLGHMRWCPANGSLRLTALVQANHVRIRTWTASEMGVEHPGTFWDTSMS